MKNIWGEILLGNQNFIFLRKYHCLHQKSFWPQLYLIKSETHSNYTNITFKLPQVNKYKKVYGRLTKLCEVLHTDKSTNKLSLQSHWHGGPQGEWTIYKMWMHSALHTNFVNTIWKMWIYTIFVNIIWYATQSVKCDTLNL